MPSDIKKTLNIKYKRFRRWIKSDEFMDLVFRVVALLIIAVMVLSVFVVML